MSHELLNKATEGNLKKDIPDFEVGDTVNVSVRILEGDKERIQVFTGTVIGRKGTGISETFTVRRLVANQGVERIFPLHSPKIASIEVVRAGKSRRAKLYYLRARVGKGTRLKETGAAQAQDAEQEGTEAQAPTEEPDTESPETGE